MKVSETGILDPKGSVYCVLPRCNTTLRDDSGQGYARWRTGWAVLDWRGMARFAPIDTDRTRVFLNKFGALMKSTSLVRYEAIGAVAILTLDNPPMHVVNQRLTRDFDAALDLAAKDPEVRAVVVTAAGDEIFCAGSDITEFVQLRAPGAAVERKLRPQKEVFGRLAHLPKPTIAAVQGLCYGGGLEIVVCCDVIVVEEQVQIASPEIKLGLFPSSGGTIRTTRRIGVGRAKELMLGGRPITAKTALAWGLVNRVVPPGQALSAAMSWAEEFADRPAVGVAACKATIDLAFDTDENDALEQALAHSERAFTSREAVEGVEAFFAKRKPVYREIPYRIPSEATPTLDQGPAVEASASVVTS